MKNIIIWLAALSISIGISQKSLAQKIGDLKGISYQAVAVDDQGKEIVGMDINNKPLYDKTIGVRFSILKGSAGAIEYQETQTAQTDQNGLFSLVIGTGTKTSASLYDSLMAIPWIDADQFLKVELAIKNDGNYKMVSLQKFQSVPYSFYTNDIADNAITTSKIRNGAVDLTTKVSNILPVKNGGTGLDGSTATDGQLLIGNSTTGGYNLANLTQGTGIIITNTPGGIQIASGVQGINSTSAGNVQIGSPGTGSCSGAGRQLAAGTTWVSASIPLAGVVLGNIVVGSVNCSLNGCIMSTYVDSSNQIRVSIYNGTGSTQCFNSNAALSVLVVK